MKKTDHPLQFQIETCSDHITQLTSLINQAYRGKEGLNRWTTEHHLVKGQRIHEHQLMECILDVDTILYSAWRSQELAGCICLKPVNGDTIEFGTFAVSPSLHGHGLGSSLLEYAERQASKHYRYFQVCVVSLNQNLIAFYQRRGYQITGDTLPYPVHAEVGIPMHEDTTLTLLKKHNPLLHENVF